MTLLSNFAETLSKIFAQLFFAIALSISMKSKPSQEDDLLLAEKNEKEDEVASDLLRQCALKDRLLAIFAHDVRSPLSSLRSLIDLLAKQRIDQKEFQRIIALLDGQIEHLHQFTENILKWTHNNSTEIKPKFEQLQLRPLIKETVGLLSNMAEIKGIYIYFDVPENTTVFADEEMIKLVLRNLVMNAIKFCHANDNVYIHTRRKNEMVAISVCDTGQGINREDIPDLFKVSHLTTKGTKNEIGIGLGLTLCKEFVEKMGGTIRVTSAREKGSCFEFTVHSPTPAPSEFQAFIDLQEKSKRAG